MCQYKIQNLGVKLMNETLNYYNTHAADFTQDTQSTDMSEKYAPFLRCIPSGKHILDLGCSAWLR